MVDSRASSRTAVSSVEERVGGSLRDVLRAFTLNPAASDSVLNDSSVSELRSESATEIIRHLKVRADHCNPQSNQVLRIQFEGQLGQQKFGK